MYIRGLNGYRLYLKIADLKFCLIFDNKDYYQYFKKQYMSFSDIKCDDVLFIILKESKNDKLNGFYFIDNKPHKKGVFLYHEEDYFSTNLINFYLKAFIELFALQYNILFLHGSSCFIEDKAYIFCGISGSGKSTIIKNIKKENILGDDTSIIKINRKKIYAYTSPFDNEKYPNLFYRKKPLGNIIILKKAFSNTMAKLNIKDATNMLYLNSKIYFYFLEKYKILKKEKKAKRKLSSIMKLVSHKEFLIKVNELIFDIVSYNMPRLLNFKKEINFVEFINSDYGTTKSI